MLAAVLIASFIGGPRRLCPCFPSLATEKKPAIGRKLGFESTLFEGAFFMSGFESDQAFAQPS